MVSVIIPIYNVSSFINKGIAYMQAQNYRDFEIIFVDDGSTDNSLALCKELANHDSRIRVYTQPNQGSGAARNLGMLQARGEYIYFYDIDDTIEPDLLQYCVETMQATCSDMMVFSYHNHDVATGSQYDILFDEMQVTSNNELKQIYVEQFVLKMNGFPWNKFYRKSFLDAHHIKFENLRIQQDEVFNLSLYPYVERLYISSRPLYHYYIYAKGNARSRYIAQRRDIYRTVNQRFRQLQNQWHLQDERLERYLHERFWNSNINGFMQNIQSEACPLNNDQKRSDFEMMASDTLMKEAIKYLYNGAGLETQMYMKAVSRKNFRKFMFWQTFFRILRLIKHKVR